MATPQGNPQGQPQAPKRRGGGAKVMAAGFVLACIGAWLGLKSYSNNPAEFNSGVVLLALGALMLLIPAIRRRDRRPRQPNGNGNHAA